MSHQDQLDIAASPLAGDASDAEALRASLSAAGYSDGELWAALGKPPFTLQLPADAPVCRARLSKDTAQNVLVELLLLSGRVSRDLVEEVLPTDQLMLLIETGIATIDRSYVLARARLVPYEGLLLLAESDNPWNVTKERVFGVSPSSHEIAHLTSRRPVRTALDLGTGCGVQALLAARHAAEVVAVDVNPRALYFAAFNAKLNGVPNVTYCLGDWFEPLNEHRFDLVVANLPYVISPEMRCLFQDSDLAGDAMARRVIEGVPRYLEEDGLAYVLCDWIVRPGDEWTTPIEQWLSDSGCDVVVLHSGTEDPVSYASIWNAWLRAADGQAFEQVINQWRAYYKRLDVHAIASGAVILRRRSSSTNWLRGIDLIASQTGPAGEHVHRLFEAADAGGAMSDAAMLETIFRPVDGLHVGHLMTAQQGEYMPHDATVWVEPGVGVRVRVDRRVVLTLMGCDGRHTLGQAVTDAANELGVEASELARLSSETVRQLFDLGLLALQPRFRA